MCREAVQYDFASVCVHPSHIARATEFLVGEKPIVCSVIGFPSGSTLSEVKMLEAMQGAGGVPVKAIIETGLLDDEQKKIACDLAVTAGASFVKTCTGFAPGCACAEDIKLMRSV
ncbi:putative multi-domain containing protein, partial [Aduncisulcus paluster]